MSPDELRAILDFEQSLKPNDPVIARWTNNFREHSTRAIVVKVNAASFRVRIIGRSYLSIGAEITIPRFSVKGRWSDNNRLAPPSYQTGQDGQK